MDARIQALPFDPVALNGLSSKLLTGQHQDNYGGAVKRLLRLRPRVSRSTAMRLRAAGLNARYPRGGIDGWQAAGRPLMDKLMDKPMDKPAGAAP